MKFDYYYNRLPTGEVWRNNLIYTSLISEDQKTFVQWYTHDSEYHQGKNQVVDQNLLNDKWARELCFLNHMRTWHPDLIPEVLDIDLINKKIYLRVDGPDLWQRSLDRNNCAFEDIVPDWQEQMLNIVRAHHDLNMYKYSMHPSSYFIVDGKLKSINYFFAYNKQEGPVTIEAHQSHLSDNRKADLRLKVEALGMSWTQPTALKDLEYLCWESFRTNYPDDFVKKVQACIS